jgi:hypothetical protein
MQQNNSREIMERLLLLFGLVTCGPGFLTAQDQSAPVRWYDDVSLHGIVSASYTYNMNVPAIPKNAFRVFDYNDNSMQVDVVELSVRKDVLAGGDAGFRFDLTAGSAIPRVARSGGLDIGDLDFHQMYASYLAPVGSGLRIDVGKFVTPLGYEVIEGYDGYNDNYSRSLLFGYAIPFTHTGLRAGYAFSPCVSSTLMIVNGWDNAVDNNRSKTVGGQVTVTPVEGLSLLAGAFYGPERDENNRDNRLILDFIGTYVVSPLVTVGVNGDFGRERFADTHARWTGVACYLRLNPFDNLSLSVRAEQFRDLEGVRTGIVQTLRELTFTPEFRPADHFILRGDVRIDRSNEHVFMKGGDYTKTQPTLALNVIYIF